MITKNNTQTIKFGKEFAKKLTGGEVLALTGDLGSGKTTFTQGLAKGLGIKNNITSPTFVLLKNYHGKINNKNIEFVHIDAYRVQSIEDIKSAGIEDYLNRKGVIMVIEWAEKIKKILPKNIINISFEADDTENENKRKISIISSSSVK